MKLMRKLAFGLSLIVTAYAKDQPNIVFVLTDDQDSEMKSLDYMPLLQKHIIDKGTLFDHHYCTVAICCPSRVNIWTGQAAHNTNVTDLFPPYGGYPVFVRNGLNENWLPVWLQQLGYNTYYTGKLFNSHNVDNYNDPPVNGFNGSDFLLDPYTYDYYGSKMSRNSEEPISYDGQYSPDVVAEKTYGFLDEALESNRPFFVVAAPIAPHSNQDSRHGGPMDIPKYALRHAHLFKDYKIPRTANYNPNVPSGVSWVKDLPQLNETVLEYHDEFQRSRLRALQSVDEMVERIVQKLDKAGVLNSTYVFYSTDNGYHIGQHRLPPGKECPFETDIHIPLAVRGPGIPAGHTAGVVSSHTDLTPTFLKLAGSKRPDLDGSPIPLSIKELASPASGEHVNVEYWGRATPEGIYGKIGNDSFGGPDKPRIAARNNTYKALRVIGEGYSLLYTVWCTGEKEFYDLEQDHEQMHNLLSREETQLAREYQLAGRSFEEIIARLDALLMVLKSCKGESCRRPWDSLHSKGNVDTLKNALKKKFDGFYADQPRVSFSSCPLGHLLDEEGPQNVNVWPRGGEIHKVDDGRKQPTFQYYGLESWWT